MQVVTWKSETGTRVDLCKSHGDLPGRMTQRLTGVYLVHVSEGLHDGICAICESAEAAKLHFLPARPDTDATRIEDVGYYKPFVEDGLFCRWTANGTHFALIGYATMDDYLDADHSDAGKAGTVLDRRIVSGLIRVAMQESIDSLKDVG